MTRPHFPDIPSVDDIIDTVRYDIEDLESAATKRLVDDCRRSLAERGSFNLEGFLTPQGLATAVAEIEPPMAEASFFHEQRHNIYFAEVPGLPPGHDALRTLDTSNNTLTGDQLAGTVVDRVYTWAPLSRFLAAVFDRPRLYPMADPLARLNVMGYSGGQGINWHFDRAAFAVTLLLQAPEIGGQFQYRRNLRSDDDPNYEGVARLLRGEDGEVEVLRVKPGTLNVFAGRYAAHRVTPSEGRRARLVAVLSFMERPDVQFSAADRIQFYGRADPAAPVAPVAPAAQP